MLSKVIFRSLSGKYFLDLVLSAVVLQDDPKGPWNQDDPNFALKVDPYLSLLQSLRCQIF